MASRFSLPPLTFGSHSPSLAVVVEIQHAGYGVHTQTVDVVVVAPRTCALEIRKLSHFLHAVVKDHRAPLFVLTARRGLGSS